MFVVITLTQEQGSRCRRRIGRLASRQFCTSAPSCWSRNSDNPGHRPRVSASLWCLRHRRHAYSTQIIVRIGISARQKDTFRSVRLVCTASFPCRYVILLGSAAVVGKRRCALYSVAAGALLLLYIGIHNALDAATWMAVHKRKK